MIGFVLKGTILLNVVIFLHWRNIESYLYLCVMNDIRKYFFLEQYDVLYTLVKSILVQNYFELQ